MSRLIETIKLSGKKLFGIEYHQRRMQIARKELFGLDDEINLLHAIEILPGISDSLFKVRVLYSTIIHDVEIHPYTVRAIHTLQSVENDKIDYNYKYEDRSGFQKMLCKCKADDILIIKNGFVTDTSYSNVVLEKEGCFYTPSTYLLNGTKRQILLEDKFILEKDISYNDLWSYEKVYLINSMLDINSQPGIPVNQVIKLGTI